MKIAVNTRLLIDGKLDGIGWFSYFTMKYITGKHPEHKFYFIFDRPYSEKFIFSKNIEPVIVPPPTRHPLLWNIWLKQTLPNKLHKIKPDIFVSLDGFLPFSIDIPSLIVIHDINFEHRPQDLPYLTAKFYRKNFKKFAVDASHIATVSQYSKNDIVNTYKISPNKISVIYNGASENYKPLNQDKIQEIRNKYTGGKPYFLFVGSLHPRKNVKGLIQAFDLFKKQTNSQYKLLIVGPSFFKNKEMNATFQSLKFKNDIIFTGHLEQNELTKVTASAFALVLVSFFEGFGIPVLEAMYCDVPVIVSNATSLPEVAGNAALYANPSDIQEIAKAMEKLADNQDLREELIEKAKIQRQKFSWEKTANKLWNAIENLEKNKNYDKKDV